GTTPGFSAIVVVTDGIIDLGSPQKNAEGERWLKEQLLPDCKRHGVRIIGVAFTEGADYELLQTMAYQTDGTYYRILKPADAPATFQQIAKGLQAAAAPAPPPVPANPVPSAAPPAQPATVPVESHSTL